MSAAEGVRMVTVDGAHVLADTRIDRYAAAIAALIDPAFLTEAGWDPARRVLSFDPEHPLLGRPVCLGSGLFDDRAGSVEDLRVVPSSAR